MDNNVYTHTVTVYPAFDLELAKVDSPDPVLAGETLTYALTVTNTGLSTAADVTVFDLLPYQVNTPIVTVSGDAICFDGYMM